MVMLLLLVACARRADDTGPTDSTDSIDTGSTPNGWTDYDCGGVPAAPALSTAAWQPGGLMPASNFSAIVGSDDGSLVYAASMLTGAFRSEDHGASWQPLRTTTTHIMSDLVLHPDDPRTVLLSSGGMPFVSHDAGETWTQLPLGDIDASDGIVQEVFGLAWAPYDAQRIYGVVTGGQVYVSEDGGATFEARGNLAIDINHNPTYRGMNHFWRLLPEAEAGGTAVFTDGMSLWTSSDGGLRTWMPSFTAPIEARTLLRDPTDPDHLLVAATDGLYGSHDAGLTWERVDDMRPTIGAWSADGGWVGFADDTTLYVSTDHGETFTELPFDFLMMPGLGVFPDELYLGWNDGIMRSRDGGASWADASVGLTDGGISVVVPHPVCSNRVMTGSRCTGGLYHSDDWGDTYTHEPYYFHYVMGIHWDPNVADRVWVVSDDTVARSDDGGVTWRTMLEQYHFHGFAVDPQDSDTLLLGSVGSGSYHDDTMQVYRSTDGGETWTSTSTGLPQSESSAHTILHWPGDPDVVLLGTYRAGDESHATGEGIGLYRSTDRGDTWTHVDGLATTDIAWLTEAPGGVAAATGDGLYLSTDEGVTWTRADGPDGYMVGADFHGDLGLALNGNGEVWRTDDGGATWRDYTAGLQATSQVDSYLSTVVIDPTGTVAWLTDFPNGVFRIGL